MKRSIWVLITFLTVLLTVFVLTQASRLHLTRALHACPRRVELRGHAQADDPMLTEATSRWQHCEPHHWRACLLEQ